MTSREIEPNTYMEPAREIVRTRLRRYRVQNNFSNLWRNVLRLCFRKGREQAGSDGNAGSGFSKLPFDGVQRRNQQT